MASRRTQSDSLGAFASSSRLSSDAPNRKRHRSSVNTSSSRRDGPSEADDDENAAPSSSASPVKRGKRRQIQRSRESREPMQGLQEQEEAERSMNSSTTSPGQGAPSRTTNGRAPSGRSRSSTGDAEEPETSGASRKRRAAMIKAEPDDESEDTEDDSDAEGSRRLIKPEPRTNGTYAGPSSQSANEYNEGDRDEKGFLPGSIVRVALNHFVTYDNVEFQPGPHLNMIIGPNGTGKSTIVCAIALGLGWKPAVLGRAKDIASYVKHGYEDGWIEVELRGLPGDPNLIVRRNISRQNNSSDWKINGKTSSAKAVNEAVAQFDISIDNLCCFLPQDKVADFARMDPPHLLLETERAAGHPSLREWHEKLIELGEGYRAVKAELDREQDEQNNLEQRNEVLGRDVERYEQRRRIEDEIALLRLEIPFAEFRDAADEYKAAKAVRTQKKADLDALKRANAPIEDKVQQMRDKKKRLEDKRLRIADAINKTQRDIRTQSGKAEQLDSDTSDLQDTLSNLKGQEKRRKETVAKLRDDIATLESELAEQPRAVDTSEVEQALRHERTEIRKIEDKIRDVTTEMEDVGNDTRQYHQTEDETLRQLKRLDDQRARRLQMLKSADRSAYEAVMWLREHGDMFEGKVYEPIMLEVSVKESRYTAHVESCLNWQVLRTFVCETRADYDRLTRELVDRQKLRLNVTELEGGRTIAQMEQNRPFTLAQIRNMGFDDYIGNLVEAPEAVKTYLFSNLNLHTIPVAIADTVKTEAVEATRQIKRYIVGNTNHTVQWSEYGSRLPQTLSRDLAPPRSLGSGTNQAEKARLDNIMKDIAAKLQEGEQKVGEMQQRIAAHREKLKDRQKTRQELEHQRADLLRVVKEWEKAKVRVEDKRKALEAELRKPSLDAQRRKLHKDISKKTAKRVEAIQNLKTLYQTVVKQRVENDLALLVEVQHSANLQAWKDLWASKAIEFKTAEKALDEAAATFLEAKAAATQLQNAAQAAFDAASSDLSHLFQARQQERIDAGEEEPSLHELTTMLITQQGKLEMAAGIASSVVEAYKKRAEQIKKLGESIMIKRRDVTRKADKIEKIRSEWHPRLLELVSNVSSKFSAAFDRIGCAGEVRVSESDAESHNYEKWGIDILVKFRDNEQLQPLTGQRQSGGERSLSTILYLMSLTELSRSPFSLVDEINQGMDQRAERAVHDQMVEVTCQPRAGQYFLITPKLLENLRYHEKMKVLIVNNGEWLPEKLDLSAYARRALQSKGLAGGRGGGSAAVAAAS